MWVFVSYSLLQLVFDFHSYVTQVVVDTALLDPTYYMTHNISMQFEEGLGSQMFQYAGILIPEAQGTVKHF